MHGRPDECPGRISQNKVFEAETKKPVVELTCSAGCLSALSKGEAGSKSFPSAGPWGANNGLFSDGLRHKGGHAMSMNERT